MHAARPRLLVVLGLTLLSVSAAGCGEDGGGDAGKGGPCSGRCTAAQVCVVGPGGERCVERECRVPDMPCPSPALECLDYLCIGIECHGHTVCGEGYYCDAATERCTAGCLTGTCPAGEYCHPAQHLCLPGCEEGGCAAGEVCELGIRRCRTCECLDEGGCPAEDYCSRLEDGGDCRCYHGCRSGAGNDNCTVEGWRCDPETRRCRDWTCLSHAQCYDAEFCQPDELGVGACLPGCRDDGSCAPGQICYLHTCIQAVRCLDDLECLEQLPGTRCDRSLSPPLCRPIPCPGGDADCPAEPELHFCNEEQQCEPGECRSDDDCPELLRCGVNHRCVNKTCGHHDECDPVREYCDLRGDQGICRAGCWRQDQCPEDRPCRLQTHLCGCVADVDCSSFAGEGQSFVCERGRCIGACAAHEDCAAGEYCDAAGHCRAGCRPDAYEPNEGQDEAPLLRLEEDEPTQTAHLLEQGLRLCGGEETVDNDWFTVELGAGDVLELDLAWESCAAGLLRLSLWRVSREDQVDDGAVGPDGRCHIHYQAHPAPMAGPVYLQVEALDPVELVYELEVNVVRAFRCVADAEEPNGSRELARRPAGACVEALSLCEGDEDWFAIPLALRDTLRVRVEYEDARGDIRAEIYPPRAGAPWLARSTGAGGLLELSLDSNRTVLEGDYLLHVQALAQGLESVETTYRFCWEIEPFQPPCVADAYEPNDERDAARNLFPGRLGPGAHAVQDLPLSLCRQDEDWYFVEVAAPSTLHIAAHNEPGPEPDRPQLIELELYRGDARIAQSASDTLDNRIDADLPEAGVYLLRVLHPQFHEEEGTFYELGVALTVGELAACVDDRLEPNDAIARATVLDVLPGGVSTLGGLSLCAEPQQPPPDEDWFSLDLRGLDPTFLRVGIRFAHADGDLDLTLRDAADMTACPQLPSQCRSESEDDDEEVRIDAARAMVYLARVHCVGRCRNHYALEWEVGAAVCPDDAHEPNDSLAQARPLDIAHRDPYALHLCPDDEDWFSVVAPGGQDVMVRLDHHFMNGDLDLQLFDGAGMLLGQSMQGVSDVECVLLEQVAAGALLHVRVLGMANDYRLGFSTGAGLSCDF